MMPFSDLPTSEEIAAAIAPPAPPDLDEAKQAAYAAINARTKAAFDAGYVDPVSTNRFAMAAEDKINWLLTLQLKDHPVAGALLFSGGLGVTATSPAGSPVEHVFADAVEFETWFLSALGWGQAIMDNARVLKTAVASSIDVAGVSSVDVESGWPA